MKRSLEKNMIDILTKFGYKEKEIKNIRVHEELGLDSLKKTELICQIEESFGFEFDIDELNSEKMDTVLNIFNIVNKHCGESSYA